MPPNSVHFNGSVNLPDADTVMREISARVPAAFRRITDGEPGERSYWFLFQLQRFQDMPEFETVSSGTLYGEEGAGPPCPMLRLADGVDPDDVAWPEIGYSAAYGDSYEVFKRLQRVGTIPAGVRLQLQFPTPVAPMMTMTAGDETARLQASYEAALFADVERLLARLPHEDIAVQWDVAVEFGMLVGGAPLADVAVALARCVDHVPRDVPVGLHLCYGDYGHKHFAEPESLALQVALANSVGEASPRPVNWLSFTVPQSRRDEEYFAPLRKLRARPATELYFALVPYRPKEQEPGTTADQVTLIDRCLAESPSARHDWGICTECGMGRVEIDDVPVLLDLHREILERHGKAS